MKTIISLVAVANCLMYSHLSRAAADDAIDFDRDIRPIFADKCFACHGPDAKSREAGLRLDQEAVATAELESGEVAIVRGKPEASALIARINSDDADERMPPAKTNKVLTDDEKDRLKRWIAGGAQWQNHWSFVAPQRAAISDGEESDFVRNELDHFILARLRELKLSPSSPADRVTLIRRLSFDLTGLPPAPDEVEAFLADETPDAYQRLVERLLSSPHFGERMAIYWLDVVRYADSNGYHSDEPRQIAPYRDYVIDAFNNNKPYNEFVVEQLAGDLLPEATMEHKIASGFNMLLQTTAEGGAQAKEYLAKYSADRVRNTSSIFLGVTMGCCECHDHKFDPFSAKDFYSFAAFFADIKEVGVGKPPAYPVATAAFRKRQDELLAQIKELEQQLAAGDPQVAEGQARWEASLASQVKDSVRLEPWHVIGPFAAASLDEAHAKAFPPETEIELSKSYDNLKWRKADEFKDGTAHDLTGDNSATYLYRTVHASQEMPLTLSLGSDDSIKLWVNGDVVLDKMVTRGVEPDQEQVTATLQPGENRLLLKISNGSGGYGFYFRLQQVGLPPEIVAILATPADSRSDQQRADLAKYYRTIAPELEAVRKRLTEVNAEKAAFDKTLPKSLMTVATDPRPIRILPRGNWLDDSGPLVEPALPEFLGAIETEGRATRLDLARWITDRNNPLTARAMANRMWKLFFGHGLALPLDDLGHQGTQPSHPQLLDWLAVELMESGWDIKHLIRLMVNSGTYRQTSRAGKELLAADSNNKWFARQTRFRLDAELVRDNALAISGLLVRRIGGPSVKPYQPAGYWRHMNFPARKWQQDSGDSLYRRGLYTWWQRMFLHPSLLAFDAPSREECTVERPRSNTPLQALVLLNDPTYVEAARVFAERIMESGGDDTSARIGWAFKQAVSRPADSQELQVLTQLYDKHLAIYREDEELARQIAAAGAKALPAEMDTSELAAWTSIARVILNLHETITRS